MKNVIEYDCECESCGGTGIYRGFAEGKNVGVVCNECEGTGKCHVKFTYNDFVGRKKIKGLKKVFHTNPGFSLGESVKGGMTYSDWLAGKKFTKGSEMRELVCPAWWYQGADYKKKPEWKECIRCGAFRDCKHFKNKQKCWDRFDRG